MGLRFEEHGNKRYAYWCTSKSVPGKSMPASVKMYIGTVSNDGKTIVPKTISTESFESPLVDGCFRIRNYGGAILASKIAERSGIVHNLTKELGDDAQSVLAASYYYAICPFHSKMVPAIDTLFLDSIFGKKGPTPGKMMRVLKNVNRLLVPLES